MTKAMPFLQKYDITFLRPPTISRGPVSVNFCFYSINFPPFAFRLAPVI